MPASRRQFIQTTTAITALSYGRVLGANDRIRIAGIGCGGRARHLLSIAADLGAEIVAACDVYEPRLALTREKIAPQAQTYTDYREALERKDVDGVIIGSPDHWHVPMTADAMRAGKDVYVEKPISHTIEEGRELLKAAAGSRQVVQVGYQQRSWDHFRHARQIIAEGKLGKITLILASWYQAYAEFDPAAADFQPAQLDWKRWLGSAPEQPVSPVRYFRWRWFWDFGGGHLTDLYSHWGDTIHWFMDADPPHSAQAMGGSYAWKFAECPDTINAVWEYPGRFAVVYNGTLHCHLEGGTIVFRGDRAMMKITRDGFAVYPEGIIARERTQYPEPEIQMRSLADGTIAHVRNFLDGIRSRREPNAPLASSVVAADAAHFGNLALRQGRRLRREEV